MKATEIMEKLDLFEKQMKEREYSAITLEKYVKDIKKMLDFMGENEVEKSTLQAYKCYLIEHYKPNTINSYIISVNVFMKWAERNDLLLKTVRIQKNSSLENVLSKQEYEKMIEVAKEQKSWRNYMIIKVLAMTGMRVGELQYLTTDALKSGKITVMRKGKYREIYMPKSLMQLLDEYCQKEEIHNGYLFFGRDQKKPLDTTGIWKMLKKIAKRADVDIQKVYPHSFRHLFAKTFMKTTGNILDLADILGHSNVETTRRYTLTTIEEKRNALEKLEL
ncbi:MAG: tyrosine-type recombinase/integrase [Lachnospiraceae bacterium]|nr:tyrosine-type recombinase/integrase [Lachnospiraceae bacterium]